MALRNSMAVNVTPLLLRVALGVVFVWAGVGKVRQAEFSPAEAATLANAGVSSAIAALHNGSAIAVPPVNVPPRDPVDTPPVPEQTVPPAPDSPSTPLPEPQGDDAAAETLGYRVVLAQSETPARVYTAADFSGPVRLFGAHRVTLMLLNASTPDANGRRLLPEQVGQGRWPSTLAWVATLTELGAGALVFLGFFTRICGLALASVMGVAMWLTVIGPNVGAADAFLWVFPNPSDFMTWQSFFLQFTLMMAALGVFFSGAGAASLDHYILGGPKDDAPPPPAPKDQRHR